MPFCPGCKHPLDDTPELAGQRVSCPKCATQFTWPRATPNVRPAATSAVPFASPTPPNESQQRVPPNPTVTRRSRNRSNRFQPATSWFDLFDWKFEKYITPWIVRATWLQFIGLAALWLVALTLAFAVSLFPELPDNSSTRRSGERRMVARVERPAAIANLVDFVDGFVLKTTAFISAIVSLVILTLWVRLVLESVIVVFDMAENLREIRVNTDGATT